jgi:hypothetical protein
MREFRSQTQQALVGESIWAWKFKVYYWRMKRDGRGIRLGGYGLADGRKLPGVLPVAEGAVWGEFLPSIKINRLVR